MAIKDYIESEMVFSFEETDVLLPEKATWYTRWEGVKMVDFIWKQSGVNLVFIEAKKSSPDFTSTTNEADKADYIQTLFEKFNAAIHSTVGLIIKTPNYYGFVKHPNIHKQIRVNKSNIKIVLIIKTAESEWLPPIQYAINTSSLFQNLCKTVGVKFIALNPEMANRVLKMKIKSI